MSSPKLKRMRFAAPEPSLVGVSHDIHLIILEYLDLLDTISLSMTCRYLRYVTANKLKNLLKFKITGNNIFETFEILNKSPIDYIHFRFEFVPILFRSPFKEFWEEHSREIESLEFFACNINSVCLGKMLRSCENLDSLKFDQLVHTYVPDDVILDPYENLKLPNVRQLTVQLSSVSKQELPESFYHMFTGLKEISFERNLMLHSVFLNYDDPGEIVHPELLIRDDDDEESYHSRKLEFVTQTLQYHEEHPHVGEIKPHIKNACHMFFKVLYIIFQNNKQLKHLNLHKTLINDTDLEMVLKIAPNQLIGLDIKCCDNLQWNESDVITNQPQLEYLDLSLSDQLQSDNLFEICEACPNLKYLYLRRASLLDDDGIIGLAKLNYLHTLDISHIPEDISFCLSHLFESHFGPTLEVLRLGGVKASEDTFLKLGMKTPNIKDLDISFSLTVTDDVMRVIIQRLKKLEKLILNGCINLSSKGLVSCKEYQGIGSLKKLKYLYLWGCREITDDCLIEASINGNLRTLVIAHCILLTDKGIEAVSRMNRKLQTLLMPECINITIESIKNLSNYSFHLNHLDIRMCNNLDNDALDYTENI